MEGADNEIDFDESILEALAVSLGLTCPLNLQAPQRLSRTPTPPRQTELRPSAPLTPRKSLRSRAASHIDDAKGCTRTSLLKRPKLQHSTFATHRTLDKDAVGRLLSSCACQGGGAVYVHGGQCAKDRASKVDVATAAWRLRTREATVVSICSADLTHRTLQALFVALERQIRKAADAPVVSSVPLQATSSHAAATKDLVQALQACRGPVVVVVHDMDHLLQGQSLVRQSQFLPELLSLPRIASTAQNPIVVVMVAGTQGPLEQASRLSRHALKCETVCV